jgi:hypothetical protein
LIGEPRPDFLGDMRGMIVEDQLDRRMGRIRGIDELYETLGHPYAGVGRAALEMMKLA